MTAAFALPFQGPPVRQLTAAETNAAFDAEMAELEAHPQEILDHVEPDSPAPLRLSKGAKAAAAADRISDDMIRAAIAEPDEIEPDPAGNGRMRLQRGTLRVVLARDGAVLSVRDRRSRARTDGSRRPGPAARQ
jgi:hypothetical protein